MKKTLGLDSLIKFKWSYFIICTNYPNLMDHKNLPIINSRTTNISKFNNNNYISFSLKA